MADAGPPLASLLTPPGRGAVAVIGFQGDCNRIDRQATDNPPRSGFRSISGKPISSFPVGRILYGYWGEVQPEEEVVVCRMDETTTEIQSHGGDAAVRRILIDLEQIGAQILPWFDWVAARKGLFQAEYHQALTQAVTVKTLSLLQPQSELFPQAIRELQSAMANEGHLDSLIERVESLLQWGNFGLHLTSPWNVVLVGRPNVGKSSLINALLGYSRSIVFDQPGTTRDVVTGETAFEGWPLQFADTAGMRKDAEELESAGMERARKRLSTADTIVLLIDISQSPHPDDHQLLEEWPHVLLVAHKSDLPNAWGEELPAHAFPVSSRTGSGVQELAGKIIESLIPQIPPSGTAMPFTSRQRTLLQQLREALPSNDRETASRICQELLR